MDKNKLALSGDDAIYNLDNWEQPVKAVTPNSNNDNKSNDHDIYINNDNDDTDTSNTGRDSDRYQ